MNFIEEKEANRNRKIIFAFKLVETESLVRKFDKI